MLSMSSLSLSVRAYGILCRIERAGNVQLTQRTLSSLEDVESNIPSRPFRSVLYVPASNTRAMNKLASLHGRSRPDAVMFDLEDGVGPDNKNEARENLLSFFEQRRSDSSTSLTFNMVRVNKMNTPWFDEDAQIASELRKIGSCDTVVLPKIEGINDLEAASTRFAEHGSDTSFWPMIETPKAILSAGEIASHPKVHGLILGTNDLGKELQLRPTGSSSKSTFSIGSTSATSREGLITSIQTTIIAARAHGKVVIDGVYNNFRDADGFQYECINGKEWGMDGKTLIHPSQVVVTNETFAPSDEEVDYSVKVVKCWENAVTEDKFSGVAVLDGALIELLHVKTARKILDMADKIKEIENQ